jgi:type IV secretory pathway VirB4 component
MANPSNYIGGGSLADASQTLAPPQQPAINAAHGALNEAKDLANRISALVDRACGSTPQLAQKVRGETSGDLFGSLRDNADSTFELLRTASSQLNRLERELSA